MSAFPGGDWVTKSTAAIGRWRETEVPLWGECHEVTRGVPAPARTGKLQADKRGFQPVAVRADNFSGPYLILSPITNSPPDCLFDAAPLWFKSLWEKQKAPNFLGASFGGDWGIWTLATVTRPTPLAGAPLRPTWVNLQTKFGIIMKNAAKKDMAERVGFEPTVLANH